MHSVLKSKVYVVFPLFSVIKKYINKDIKKPTILIVPSFDITNVADSRIKL